MTTSYESILPISARTRNLTRNKLDKYFNDALVYEGLLNNMTCITVLKSRCGHTIHDDYDYILGVRRLIEYGYQLRPSNYTYFLARNLIRLYLKMIKYNNSRNSGYGYHVRYYIANFLRNIKSR